jgi:hypothetical protein
MHGSAIVASASAASKEDAKGGAAGGEGEKFRNSEESM